MAEVAVKLVASSLGKLLAAEVNYLGGVTDKVEKLQTELNMLAAFLMEVQTNQQANLMQNILSEGRNLAYDCQDVIETYILEVGRHGYEQYAEGCQLGSVGRWAFLLWKAIAVHKIRSKIEDLNNRISTLKSELMSYGVTAGNKIDADPKILDPQLIRRFYTHKREEQVVVGLEKDLSLLVERLLDPSDQTIIVIWGMGGLGKSTLASELYHHPKIKEGGDFHAFGWAPASKRLQPDRVLRSLMYSLVRDNDHDARRKIDEEIRADRAHAALYNMMKQAKCLVVVDDIWTSDDWARLEPAFPQKTAMGSRIILTTRNQNILSPVLDQNQVHLHPMEGLDETNSWELFKHTTFLHGTPTDSTKEILGREILRSCNGVPLAIVVIGKALKMKDKVEDWKQMRDNIFARVGRGGTPDNPYKEVNDVLQVSYDELPFYLKHCFLQFASLPQDYKIWSDSLFQLWAAEGLLLKQDPNDELEEEEDEEDIAKRYLNELVSRSMVQAEEYWDNLYPCSLHDLMRDVCIDIAKRQGFLQTVKCQTRMLLSKSDKHADHLLMTTTRLSARDKRLRRQAVHVSSGYQEPQTSSLPTTTSTSTANVSRAPSLRSLILFPIGEQRDAVDSKLLMETVCKDNSLLRVFHCERIYLTGKFPKNVGNLIHLRYLSLRYTAVTELPSSIQNLQWLQTLDLMVDRVVEDFVIPNIFWKMKQLRHLYLPPYREQGELQANRVTGVNLQGYSIKGGGVLRLDGLHLQTLKCLHLDSVDPNGASAFNKMRSFLGACETNRDSLYPILQCSSIKSFKLTLHGRILLADPSILSTCEAHVNFLRLYAEPDAKIHLRQQLMLPNSMVYLYVSYVQLHEDPLPVLEKLPNLQYLALRMCYGGQKMVCSATGFPQLTYLHFEGLSSLSQWEVEHGALHKLKMLNIVNCLVEKFPDAIPSSVTGLCVSLVG